MRRKFHAIMMVGRVLLGSNAQSKGKNRTAPFITKNESEVFYIKKIITEGKKVLGHPSKISDFADGSGSYNTKKKTTIIALSLTAVCLAGGLFYYVGTLNNSEPPTLPTQTPPSTESQIVVPEIKPESTQGSTDNSATISGTPSIEGDVQDKPSDGKPKTPDEATSPAEPPKTEDGKDKTPPKTPDTSTPDTGKDHAFTPENPSKPPEYKPEQTKPNQDTGKPKDGDTKDGKIYIEGFGWIENEGGGSDVKGTDNGNHNGNKVGEM